MTMWNRGWDPFEVWRTRVLQPRLAEARAENAGAAGSRPALPSLVG